MLPPLLLLLLLHTSQRQLVPLCSLFSNYHSCEANLFKAQSLRWLPVSPERSKLLFYSI